METLIIIVLLLCSSRHTCARVVSSSSVGSRHRRLLRRRSVFMRKETIVNPSSWEKIRKANCQEDDNRIVKDSLLLVSSSP